MYMYLHGNHIYVHYSHMEELGELRVKVHMAGTRVTSSQPWRSHVRGEGVSELTPPLTASHMPRAGQCLHSHWAQGGKCPPYGARQHSLASHVTATSLGGGPPPTYLEESNTNLTSGLLANICVSAAASVHSGAMSAEGQPGYPSIPQDTPVYPRQYIGG